MIDKDGLERTQIQILENIRFNFKEIVETLVLKLKLKFGERIKMATFMCGIARNYIYVRYPQTAKAELLIYNAIGSLVKNETINNNCKILLHDLSSGMYTYKLIIDKQNYYGKITIKK